MTKNRIIFILLGIIVLAIGLCLGIFVKNIPVVVFKNEIDLFSALTFIVTLGIGVIYPFLIKKWIDDNKSIKSYLVQEVEVLEGILKKNENVINECYENKKIDTRDRDSVNFNLFKADLQIESIENQFKISFPNKSKLISKMKECNESYYHFLTGGNFMVSDFQIDSRFYKEHQTQLNKLIMGLKEIIHKIHKL